MTEEINKTEHDSLSFYLVVHICQNSLSHIPKMGTLLYVMYI